jgi:hypothetical protein
LRRTTLRLMISPRRLWALIPRPPASFLFFAAYADFCRLFPRHHRPPSARRDRARPAPDPVGGRGAPATTRPPRNVRGGRVYV